MPVYVSRQPIFRTESTDVILVALMANSATKKQHYGNKLSCSCKGYRPGRYLMVIKELT